MAASRTESLVFTEDLTANGRSRMNFEVYSPVFSAQIQSKAAKLISVKKEWETIPYNTKIKTLSQYTDIWI